MDSDLLIVSAIADEPFASDVASACGKTEDYSDILSLKTFLNGEFCPRFISDPTDQHPVGNKLSGRTVVLVSACSPHVSRNEATLRDLLVARAAKENGATRIVLLQPDLFFAAQDRGPRPAPQLGEPERSLDDLKRFDGQPSSSLLHAEMLRLAGVSSVFTVHTHSPATDRLYQSVFGEQYANLIPTEVFARYILDSDVTMSAAENGGVILCAPDQGAREFVREMVRLLELRCDGFLSFDKVRASAREVSLSVNADSASLLHDLNGREVMIFDDMIRSGVTIRESCRKLKEAGARRVVFFVTHFWSSREARENLNGPEIDEIVTTDCIPTILNRDQQGRLRRKLTVLKIAPWIASRMLEWLGCEDRQARDLPAYDVDMSSKNPRYTRRGDVKRSR